MNIYLIMFYLTVYPYAAIARIIASYITIGMIYMILSFWQKHGTLKAWMILFLVSDASSSFLLLFPWSNLSLILYCIAVIAWITALAQMVALG